MMIWEWRLSRFTRIELLLAEEGRRRLQLSLHRNGVFAMHETDRDFGLSMCGNWEQLPNRRIRLFGFNGQQAYELEKTGLEWQCHESNPAQEGESSYVMDQLRFRPAVSESVRKG